MAKKLNTPKYDIDEELDFPDFDFDITPPKDDRSPTTKIKDAAISGAKSALGDTNFIHQLIRDTLPPEFGQLDDMRQESVEGVKKLYNSAVKEVKPSLFEMTKAVDKLIPEEKKYLKEKVAKIKDWASPEKSWKTSEHDKRKQKESDLALELGDVFGEYQAKEQQREDEKEATTKAEQKVRDVLDLGRHRDQIKLLTSISESTQVLSQYTTGVNVKFQRKSLEIQLRHYDLAMEAHKSNVELSTKINAQLELVAKNTALPEFVKLRKSEAWKEQMRNSFISNMNRGLFGNVGNEVRDFFTRIGEQAKNVASQASSAFAMGAMGIDAVQMQMQGDEDFGLEGKTKEELIADMVGAETVKSLARKGGSKLREKLDKYEPLTKLAKDVGYDVRNVGTSLRKYADNQDFNDSWLKGAFKDFLRVGLGPGNKAGSVQEDSIYSSPDSETGLRSHTGFTNQSNKSLNEIIPGYLARIYREIQVLRTGDTSIDLTSYDYTKNAFADSKVVSKNLMDTIVSPGNKDYHNRQLDEIFSKIDPENVLDAKTKGLLGRHLTRANYDKKLLDQDYLTNPSNFMKSLGGDEVKAKQIAKLFGNYYGDDAPTSGDRGLKGFIGKRVGKASGGMGYRDRRNSLDSNLRGLGRSFSDPRALYQEIVNLGQYAAVKDMGLTNEYGSFDIDRLIDLYNSETTYEGKANTVKGENLKYPEFPKSLVSPAKTTKTTRTTNPSTNLVSKDIINAINTASQTSTEYLEKANLIHELNLLNLEDINKLTSQIKFDPITDKITNTNDILGRIEKLITDNLKITIVSERRSIRREFDLSQASKVANDLKDKMTGYYDQAKYTVKGQWGKAKEQAGEAVNELHDLLNRVEQDIRESNIPERAKGEAQSRFEQIKDILRGDGRQPGEGYDKDTTLGSIRYAYDKTLGKAFNPADRAVRALFGFGKKTVHDKYDKYKPKAQTLWGKSKALAERLIIIDDVWVEGDANAYRPRLTAGGLQSGQYFDRETKEPIRGIEDIRGDVVDINGNILLSKEEIPRAYTKPIMGRVKRLVTTLAERGYNFAASVYDKVANKIIPNAVTNVVTLAKTIGGGIRNLFDMPVDIYVKDQMDKPVLLAVTMKAGGYYSKTTGAVVDRPSKIDGAILDKDGNHILTEDMLKIGIVDKDGKTIEGPYSKMIKLGFGLAGKAFKLVTGAAKAFGNMIGKGVDLGGEFLTGLINKFNYLLGDGRSYDVLVEIRNLLDTRLPKPKSRDPFDLDGDGDRDGSVVDQNQQAKEADDKKDKEAKTPEGPKDYSSGRENSIDRAVRLAKEGKEKVKDWLGMDEDGPDVDIDIDTNDKSGKKGRGRGKAGKGKAGLLKRGARAILGSGKGLLGTALKIAAPVGMAYSAYSGVQSAMQGDLTGAAMGAGGTLLGAMGTFGVGTTLGALGTAGSAIASGTMAAGTALAPLLMSPVGLGVIGAGIALYAGYKLYKYVTTPNMKPLSRHRMAQYGFASGEEDQIKKIQALEKFLLPYVKYEDGGIPQIQMDAKAAADIPGLFGFDPDDRAMAERFAIWMQERFKPVYLHTLGVIHSMKAEHQLDLTKVDEAEPEVKLKYLNLVKLENGPYTVYVSPFPEIQKLSVGTDIVAFNWGLAEREISVEAKKAEGTKKKTLEGSDIAGASAVALTADQARDKLGLDENTTKDSDAQIKDYSTFSKITKFMQGVAERTILKIPGVALGLGAVTYVGEKLGKFFGYRVDAEQAVRYKTYGLVEMDASKVRALRALEDIIQSKVQFKGDGSAIWTGQINEFLGEVSYHFGLPDKTGPKTVSFVQWFSERFITTYLNYRSWLKQTTNQDEQSLGEKALKSQDRYDIASKVAACPVWDKTTSPWVGYTLNTDPRTTRDNLVLLRDLAKDQKLVEAKKKDAVTQDVSNAVNKKPSEAVAENIKPTVIAAKETLAANNQTNQATHRNGEGESPPRTSAVGAPTSTTTTSPGNLTTAQGDLRDGNGGDAFIHYAMDEVGRAAHLGGINPHMLKLFKGMAQEYGELTGKKITVNSGTRTYAEQERLYKKLGKDRAAAPGTSLHEFGLAIDIPSKIADELDKLGLMRKYGFTRPVGKEPWHIEMAGLQKDVQRGKRDAEFANAGILASPGRGGSGFGTDPKAGKYSRNPAMAESIFNKGISAQGVADRERAGLPAIGPNDSQSEAMDQMVGRRTLLGRLANNQSPNAIPTSAPSADIRPSAQANQPTTAGDAEGYNKVSLPTGAKGYDNVKDLIRDASNLVGVDEKTMTIKAAQESGFRPGAKAGTSNASGLYQFVPKTWNEMMTKYARKYGIPPGTQPSDPRANAILAAQYMKDNEGVIQKAKGSMPITPADRYMAHWLGAEGARQILEASDTAIAADIRPAAARDKTHRHFFYHENGQPKTVAEFKATVEKKLSGVLQAHGVDARRFDKSTQLAKAPEANGFMRTNFQAPSSSEIMPEAERVSTSVYEQRKRQELTEAMRPATIATPTPQAPTIVSNAPQSQDNNNFFSGLAKTSQESLKTQKDQLDVLKEILTKIDPTKFAQVITAAIAQAVKGDADASSNTPTNNTPARRAGIVDPGKAPISMKRMT